MLMIPQSLQTEHEEIHEALTNATRAPGRVGAAAKELAAVLHPHFERENQIALPPLGLLAPLAAGQTPAGLQEGGQRMGVDQRILHSSTCRFTRQALLYSRQSPCLRSAERRPIA